jgi:glycosyltransferase involved in cell wall biosynthesis
VKEVLSCLLGMFCRAGVDIFIFPRLGFPQAAQTTGYISGLFVMAGFQFGLVVGVFRCLYFEFQRREGRDAPEASHPKSGGQELVTSKTTPQTLPALDESHPFIVRGAAASTHEETEKELRSRVPVTVVMPVLNEASRVGEAVASLSWADEVIVVDGGSTDATAQIARGAGAAVLNVCAGTIAAQRNAGISAARNHWVFALDIDERIQDALRTELAAVLKAPRYSAYRVRLRNFYLGRELRHGSWGRDWHVRLFPKYLRFVERRVHESLEPVSGVGTLSACLEHTPYQDLNHHFSKMMRYAFWGGQDLYSEGRRARIADVTFVPAWRFVREYVLYSGWRDGKHGLVAAALSGCAALFKFAHLFALEWGAATPEAGKSKPQNTSSRMYKATH